MTQLHSTTTLDRLYFVYDVAAAARLATIKILVVNCVVVVVEVLWGIVHVVLLLLQLMSAISDDTVRLAGN